MGLVVVLSFKLGRQVLGSKEQCQSFTLLSISDKKENTKNNLANTKLLPQRCHNVGRVT